eukprot:jgi/Chrzof1/2797/UNPLg00711.t1
MPSVASYDISLGIQQQPAYVCNLPVVSTKPVVRQVSGPLLSSYVETSKDAYLEYFVGFKGQPPIIETYFEVVKDRMQKWQKAVVTAHDTNHHLPAAIRKAVDNGLQLESVCRSLEQIRDRTNGLNLTLPQIREAFRLLGHTRAATPDTAVIPGTDSKHRTSVTIHDFKSALHAAGLLQSMFSSLKAPAATAQRIVEVRTDHQVTGTKQNIADTQKVEQPASVNTSSSTKLAVLAAVQAALKEEACVLQAIPLLIEDEVSAVSQEQVVQVVEQMLKAGVLILGNDGSYELDKKEVMNVQAAEALLYWSAKQKFTLDRLAVLAAKQSKQTLEEVKNTLSRVTAVGIDVSYK